MPTPPPVKRFETPAGIRVYRIGCRVMPELSGRVYLVLEAGPPTLVDTGSGDPHSNTDIMAAMETIRHEFGEMVHLEDIRRILITHAHFDHVGGLAFFVDRQKVEVGLHPLERSTLLAQEERHVLREQGWERLRCRIGAEQLPKSPFFDVRPPLPRHKKLEISIDMEDRSTLDGLTFLHTPGHASGHVCIVADGLLLCGDHLLSRTIPQLWPESTRPYLGLDHYLESLTQLRRMPGLTVGLAGHERVIENVYRRIDDIFTAQDRRNNRLIEMLTEADRPMTVAELTRSIYAVGVGRYATLALMDIAARAEYLHYRGKLKLANLAEVAADEGVAWRYEVSSDDK